MNARLLIVPCLLVASVAHAEETEVQQDAVAPVVHHRPTFEIGFQSELHWLVQSSARVTSQAPSQGSAFVDFAYSPIAPLDVYVGYRSLYETSRDDRGYTLTTDGDAAVVGARLRYPLLSWFGLVAALDLEALHLDHQLDVGQRSGQSGEWTFGVAPRAGVELTLDLGGWAGVLRVEGGYAFRGAPAVSMALSSDAAEVDPVALGTVDLSGPLFALSLGIRF